MYKNLPNILTLIRIIVIPFIFASFYLDKSLINWVAASLFLIASITDFLDGYLARTFSAQTAFGKFLDPVADKLLVVSVILLLVHNNAIEGVEIFAALAIVCREILVSGLREFLATINVTLNVSNIGKAKTLFQMTALFLLLLGKDATGIQLVETIGIITLWIASFLTVLSGAIYLKQGLKHI
ncbi:MAG: CDP-diacylglycerol--glycerol-3-phosphate 3-phosphatidyltransferase [Cyanobacteria bacterium P01_A01_bin.83]